MGEKLNFDLWEFLLAINFQTFEIDLPNQIWDGLWIIGDSLDG